MVRGGDKVGRNNGWLKKVKVGVRERVGVKVVEQEWF